MVYFAHVLCVALFGSVVAADIKITPDVVELVLKPNANFEIRCEGDEPVIWTSYEKVEEIDFKTKTGSNNQCALRSMKGKIKERNVANLSLDTSDINTVGYYYCIGKTNESLVDLQYSQKMYIYIQNDKNLLVAADTNVDRNEFGKFVIPCRPTSPVVNISLTHSNGTKVSDEHYDPKIGYTLKSPSRGNYTCKATYSDNISSKKVFNVAENSVKTRETPNIDITNENGTIFLNCSITVPEKKSYFLYWIVPDKKKLENKQVQIERVITNGKTMSRLLKIQNSEKKEKDEYVCEIRASSGDTTRESKVLNSNSTSNDDLNVTIVNGKNIIRTKEGQNVVLKVLVSRKDNIRLTWLQPSGKNIEKSDKFDKFDNDTSLKIFNTTGTDSGVYKLTINLVTSKKEIDFTVLVESKPSVKLVKTINFMHVFYQVNSISSIQCNVYGYPLPSVEWAFSNCTDKVCEEENFTTISKKWHKQVVQSETFILSTLSIPVNESGKFRCKALESSEVINFFVADFSNSFNGLAIMGPNIVVEGDYVKIKCSAAIIKYKPKIDWDHRTLKNIEHRINSSHMNISVWKSRYSYNSELSVFNVNSTFDGEYICSANDIEGSNNSLKVSYPLMVKTSYSPIIYLREKEHVDEVKTLYYPAKTTPDSEKNNNFFENPVVVILCGLFFVIFGTLSFGLVIFLKMKWKLHPSIKGAIHSLNPELRAGDQAYLLPFNKKYEFPKNKIELLGDKPIGSGAFGVVYKAIARDICIDNKIVTTTVAVKMVKKNSGTSHIQALESELKILVHIGRHVNIVNLLGAYTGNKIDENLMVIVEYCQLGNILDYMIKQKYRFVNQITSDGHIDWNIQSSAHFNQGYGLVPINTDGTENPVDSGTETSNLSSDTCDARPELQMTYQYQGDYEMKTISPLRTHDLLCWSFQVAQGMEYLAKRKVLHGDLAARNILLAEGNIVKVCDFGLAKSLYNDDYYRSMSQGIMPIKWMAIESLSSGIFSTESDVWAFGVAMWEMFSLGLLPYPKIINKILLDKLIEGCRLEQPTYANFEIYKIMLNCWDYEPTKRPSFTKLIEQLGNLLQDDTKMHYFKLNEAYEEINAKESPPNDYLSLMCAPNYLNYLNIKNVSRSNSQLNIPKYSELGEPLV